MPRPSSERLAAAGARVGDTIRLVRGDRADEGVLMPRPAQSAPDVAIVKLASGYNVGVRIDDATRIDVVRRAEPRPRPARSVRPDPSKPVVAFLGTGGTIASYVDYRTGAVHPAATAEELAFANPELFEIANVRAEVVFQVFSEDFTPRHWLELARRIKAAFDAGARGVVVPHGTDTLGFSAAALAFLLRDLPGPVVLVGAQRSSDRPSSDAASNLAAATRVAAQAALGEVVVCMHAGMSDDRILIHRGVRVRKDHTSRRDAFESVNGPPLGHVDGDRIVLSEEARRPSKGPVRCATAVAEDVAFLHSHPGLTGEAIERVATGRGLVVAGTGLGHLPTSTLAALERLRARGVVVAMTSQCLWGRVDLDVYSTGRDLQRVGVIPMDDVLPEVAYAKLCWALANAPTGDEAARWMRADQVGETTPRSPFQEGGGPHA